RRHTRSLRDWSSDVCSSDLRQVVVAGGGGDSGPGDHDLAIGGPCMKDSDCPTGRYCSAQTCVDCLMDGHCPSGKLCNPTSHVCRSEERRVGKECRARWWGGH